MSTNPAHPHWQVDRHINIATIISIAGLMVGQFVAGIVWVSSVSNRLDAVEKKVENQALVIAPLVERSIRLETRLENLIDGQGRVEQILRNSSILTYIPTGEPLPRPTKPALTR